MATGETEGGNERHTEDGSKKYETNSWLQKFKYIAKQMRWNSEIKHAKRNWFLYQELKV